MQVIDSIGIYAYGASKYLVSEKGDIKFINIIKPHTNALSSNDVKRMQSVDSVKTYSYAMSKDIVSEKEEIKCNNIIKRYKND